MSVGQKENAKIKNILSLYYKKKKNGDENGDESWKPLGIWWEKCSLKLSEKYILLI